MMRAACLVFFALVSTCNADVLSLREEGRARASSREEAIRLAERRALEKGVLSACARLFPPEKLRGRGLLVLDLMRSDPRRSFSRVKELHRSFRDRIATVRIEAALDVDRFRKLWRTHETALRAMMRHALIVFDVTVAGIGPRRNRMVEIPLRTVFTVVGDYFIALDRQGLERKLAASLVSGYRVIP